MSTYQSAAESAATIRQRLKSLYGITRKQVSVRSRSYSLGSSVDIEIHDPNVDLKEVRNAANFSEHIRYCEASGEILGGGNRFLDVKYSAQAVATYQQVEATFVAKALAMAQDIKARFLAGDLGGNRLSDDLLMGITNSGRVYLHSESSLRSHDLFELTEHAIAFNILAVRG